MARAPWTKLCNVLPSPVTSLSIPSQQRCRAAGDSESGAVFASHGWPRVNSGQSLNCLTRATVSQTVTSLPLNSSSVSAANFCRITASEIGLLLLLRSDSLPSSIWSGSEGSRGGHTGWIQSSTATPSKYTALECPSQARSPESRAHFLLVIITALHDLCSHVCGSCEIAFVVMLNIQNFNQLSFQL